MFLSQPAFFSGSGHDWGSADLLLAVLEGPAQLLMEIHVEDVEAILDCDLLLLHRRLRSRGRVAGAVDAAGGGDREGAEDGHADGLHAVEAAGRVDDLERPDEGRRSDGGRRRAESRPGEVGALGGRRGHLGRGRLVMRGGARRTGLTERVGGSSPHGGCGGPGHEVKKTTEHIIIM